MARDHEKQIDKTFLSVEQAETRGFVHRDYLAHCLRWSYVLNTVKANNPERILDAGCGIEAPLAKTLYTNRQTQHWYLGVDYGPIEPTVAFNGVFQPVFIPNQAIDELSPELVQEHLKGAPTLITCFEVSEHMMPDRLTKTYMHLRSMVSKFGRFVVSTPCYDSKVGPAANHINELTYNAMGALLENTGWEIVAKYGTFASQKDYLASLREHYGDVGVQLWEEMKRYYDSNLTSVLWAPLFPAQSRNVLWECKPRLAENDATREFDEAYLSPGSLNLSRRGQCEDQDAWGRALKMMGLRT